MATRRNLVASQSVHGGVGAHVNADPPRIQQHQVRPVGLYMHKVNTCMRRTCVRSSRNKGENRCNTILRRHSQNKTREGHSSLIHLPAFSVFWGDPCSPAREKSVQCATKSFRLRRPGAERGLRVGGEIMRTRPILQRKSFPAPCWSTWGHASWPVVVAAALQWAPCSCCDVK